MREIKKVVAQIKWWWFKIPLKFCGRRDPCGNFGETPWNPLVFLSMHGLPVIVSNCSTITSVPVSRETRSIDHPEGKPVPIYAQMSAIGCMSTMMRQVS
jgi:hypothetical protein